MRVRRVGDFTDTSLSGAVYPKPRLAPLAADPVAVGIETVNIAPDDFHRPCHFVAVHVVGRVRNTSRVVRIAGRRDAPFYAGAHRFRFVRIEVDDPEDVEEGEGHHKPDGPPDKQRHEAEKGSGEPGSYRLKTIPHGIILLCRRELVNFQSFVGRMKKAGPLPRSRWRGGKRPRESEHQKQAGSYRENRLDHRAQVAKEVVRALGYVAALSPE